MSRGMAAGFDYRGRGCRSGPTCRLSKAWSAVVRLRTQAGMLVGICSLVSVLAISRLEEHACLWEQARMLLEISGFLLS